MLRAVTTTDFMTVSGQQFCSNNISGWMAFESGGLLLKLHSQCFYMYIVGELMMLQLMMTMMMMMMMLLIRTIVIELPCPLTWACTNFDLPNEMSQMSSCDYWKGSIGLNHLPNCEVPIIVDNPCIDIRSLKHASTLPYLYRMFHPIVETGWGYHVFFVLYSLSPPKKKQHFF